MFRCVCLAPLLVFGIVCGCSSSPSNSDSPSVAANSPVAPSAPVKSSVNGLVGHWAGKPTPKPGSEKMPGGDMLTQSMSVTLDLHDDKTFDMTLLAYTLAGTWSSSANQVQLVVTKFMGMDKDAFKAQLVQQAKSMPDQPQPNVALMDQPLTCSVNPDGKSMVLENGDNAIAQSSSSKGIGRVTLTKDASASTQ